MRKQYGSLNAASLNGAGFLGCFVGDDTVHQIRLFGRAANAFGFLQKTGEQGVRHAECDKAVHPDDLAEMIERRAKYVGRGGRWSMRYRVRNRFSDGPLFTWIEAHYTVHIDAFGIPVRTEGILLDVAALMAPDEQPTVYDDLAGIVSGLGRASALAKRRSMLDLQRQIDGARTNAMTVAMNRLLE